MAFEATTSSYFLISYKPVIADWPLFNSSDCIVEPGYNNIGLCDTSSVA